VALLVAAALCAGTAAASAAQTPDPATLARVDALAAMARGNVGLLKLIDQLTRNTIAGHPALHTLGNRVVAQDKALIVRNNAIIKDDERIKADEQKLRIDQEKLKSAPPDKAAALASAIGELTKGIGSFTGAARLQAAELQIQAARQQASRQQLVDLMKALNAQTARLIAQLTSSVSDNTSRMHQIASSIRNV
jgi:hypothetical protein